MFVTNLEALVPNSSKINSDNSDEIEKHFSYGSVTISLLLASIVFSETKQRCEIIILKIVFSIGHILEFIFIFVSTGTLKYRQYIKR